MKSSTTHVVIEKVSCPLCNKSRLFDAMLGEDRVATLSIKCPNCKKRILVMLDRLNVYAKALGH